MCRFVRMYGVAGHEHEHTCVMEYFQSLYQNNNNCSMLESSRENNKMMWNETEREKAHTNIDDPKMDPHSIEICLLKLFCTFDDSTCVKNQQKQQ